MAEETTTELPELTGTPLVTPEMLEEETAGPRLILPGEDNPDDENAPVEEGKKKTEEAPAENAPTPAPAPVTEPEPVGVQDPGEFTPTDRSFEVTVYDAESKNPQTRKINSPEEWDQLLQGDPNLGSAAALLRAERAAAKMDIGAEREKADWEKSKQEYDQATEAEQQRTEALNTMANEMVYLVNRGELPAAAAEYQSNTSDWRTPEAQKDPGVKAQTELLDYMRDENNARTRAGLKPMTSVLDAWNAFQLDQSKKTAETAKTRAAEARKAAGARISGTNSAPVNVAPKGIMVGRPGALDT